jgi:pimeloyl-ACP methyl ester carboxylesterase
MAMFSRMCLVLTAFILSGCASGPLENGPPALAYAGPHKLVPYNKLQYLSCDYRSHYDSDHLASVSFPNDPDFARVASDNVEFAMMASNVYRDVKGNPAFRIPGWEGTLQLTRQSNSGLMFDHYERIRDGRKEVVIAVRGTDGPDLRDWANNLSVYFEPDQYRQVREYMAGLVADPANKAAKITVVGHSLGGGIALNMSYLYPNVAAVAFDSSPRGIYSADHGIKNSRIVIYEDGEFLSLARRVWHRRLPDIKEYRLNLMRYSPLAAPLGNHNMYQLARGLLLYAQQTERSDMRALFRQNFAPVDYQGLANGAASPGHDREYCERLTAESI